jgi:hypothetical protein
MIQNINSDHFSASWDAVRRMFWILFSKSWNKFNQYDWIHIRKSLHRQERSISTIHDFHLTQNLCILFPFYFQFPNTFSLPPSNKYSLLKKVSYQYMYSNFGYSCMPFVSVSPLFCYIFIQSFHSAQHNVMIGFHFPSSSSHT